MQTEMEIQIDELVLHGFSPGDRYRISEAVEQELARLFAEQGRAPQPSQGREVTQVDGGAFEMARNANPETTGAQIAQSVYVAVT